MKREKLGKLAVEAMEKPLETTDAREIGKEMTKDYVSELIKTTKEGRKNYSGDFFVVVITKNERTLKNVFRNFFLYRYSCPTPDYDQAVYHYVKKDDELNFLWVIPNKPFCLHVLDNILTLDPEYKGLSKFILDFNDGTLYRKAKELNNEDVLEGRIILKEIKE